MNHITYGSMILPYIIYTLYTMIYQLILLVSIDKSWVSIILPMNIYVYIYVFIYLF